VIRRFRLRPNSTIYELKALRRAYSISRTSWECEFGTPPSVHLLPA